MNNVNFVIIKRLFLIGLLSGFYLLPAYAGEGETLLNRFLNDTKTMSADFTQTLQAEDGAMMQQSAGRFYLHKPGKFRWNYDRPYAQEIISDGVNIWINDIDLQQVTVQKQSLALKNTPMALLQDMVSVEQAFDIKSLDHQKGVYRMLLSAKTKQTDFKNIILGVNEKGLQFMQLKDQFDQTTDIVFSNIKQNRVLDESLFRFVPPKGSDVFGGD